MNELLRKSAELEDEIAAFADHVPLDLNERESSASTLCGIVLEHSVSAKILFGAGKFTSAVSLFRLQYEIFVRAMWMHYAASDAQVEKLGAVLTPTGAKKAEKMLMLSEMLDQMEGKAPAEAVAMLREFKESSWKALNSFVHGWIHALARHRGGYPEPLLMQTLKCSNGVSLMAGMLLVIISNDPALKGQIPKLQVKFNDCLPPWTMR